MEIPDLQHICAVSISRSLFQKHIRWRKLTDLAFEFREILDELAPQSRISPAIRKCVKEAIVGVLAEVRRWDSKHSEMFVESKKRRAVAKTEILRTFYSHLVWKRYRPEIDDVATCSHLISTELKNWPLMQFQFACLYAKTELIFDDWKFDKYRRATFKIQLSDHPVYDFWLTLMESRPDVFFDTDRRVANQKLTQCFGFAIRNGYRELMEFIWQRITDRHRESVGLLEWRTQCLRARDAQTMQFLCHNLCRMNPVGTARIAWAAFFDAFHHLAYNEKSDIMVPDQYRRKFEFLLKNSCPILRQRLLKMDNFRLLCDAFRLNLSDIFSLLLNYLPQEDIATAREYVDRIFDRKKSRDAATMRTRMLRRQFTTGN
ncbi:unnamed protein product [Caenorhabditis angaria]|uniref:Uncharacterized protein n=1 Tax=Caenorhabditis angaria TaxID=860376 RepID=A0A9P1N2E4_9PELO|nr:unnamed protein product [Caenorhabditis angaria]